MGEVTPPKTGQACKRATCHSLRSREGKVGQIGQAGVGPLQAGPRQQEDEQGHHGFRVHSGGHARVTAPGHNKQAWSIRSRTEIAAFHTSQAPQQQVQKRRWSIVGVETVVSITLHY
jgi:hypothetical protein